MSIFLIGTGTLGLLIACHALVSRLVRVKNHALVISAIAFVLCVASLAVFFLVSGSGGLFLLPDLLRLLLLEGVLVCTYLGLFTGIEDDSPSMALARRASLAGKNGFSEADAHQVLPADLLFLERIEAMRRDGWIVARDGHWQLTALGWFWARFFGFGRRLFAFRAGQDTNE
jgi:hypothetical protein